MAQPTKNLPFKFKPIKQNFQKGRDSVSFIIGHDTGNKGRGANAEMHYRYFNDRYIGASAHYFVDDKQIIQIIGDSNTAWAVGDNQGYGRALNGAKNRNSISVELCIGADSNYDIAYANFIELMKNLSKKYPKAKIARHYDVSRKSCPGTMRSNNWAMWNKLRREMAKPMILKIDLSKDSNAVIVGEYQGESTSGSIEKQAVKKGDSGIHVKELQKNLNDFGWNAGKEDGIAGQQTHNAIIAFQRAMGLGVDGIFGKSSFAVLDAAVAKRQLKFRKKEIHLNDKGDHVKELQKNLNYYGWNAGAEDGVAGKQTVEAIKQFQRMHGLSVVGYFDEKSFEILNKALAKTAKKKREKEVHLNDKGAIVKQLQENLNFYGWNAGKEDGHAGEQTMKAIRDFQRMHGLPIVGYFDEKSFKFLNDALAKTEVNKKPEKPSKPEITKPGVEIIKKGLNVQGEKKVVEGVVNDLRKRKDIDVEVKE